MEERERLLRGSPDVQTAHEQPTTGMPREVPVPRKVIEREEELGI